MAVDDSLMMRDRVVRQGGSIRALLDAKSVETLAEVEPEAELPLSDKLPPLPKPGDPYKAHSRTSNKPLLTFRLMLGDGSYEGFAYADLRRVNLKPAAEPGGGMVIVLRFMELEATEVTISGRNLDMLYDLVSNHHVSWVRELPPKRDFLEAEATVITGIAIKTLEG